MKTLILTICLVLAISSMAGCTVQFKATDFEGEGSIAREFHIDGFAWTENPTLFPNPENSP